jgi:transcriptional regulator with XRE-family HTH domain/SAM-dependent methyltransferase
VSTISAIGTNLLRLRSQRGLTLAGLSERSGIAKSTLSQLENGDGNPTIETLWAIANAFGVPFGDLIDEPQGNHGSLSGPGSTVRLIERSTGNPPMEVYLMELLPGCHKNSAPHPAGVRERLTVLSGALWVGHVDRPQMLRAGDSHAFEAHVPHVYAATEQGARALVVIEYPRVDRTAWACALHLQWPETTAAWAGLRSAIERALLEVANGLGARILRLRSDRPAERDDLTSLRRLLGELAGDPSWRWPALASVDGDARGACVSVVPVALSAAAFAARDLAPSAWAGMPLVQTCTRLARLAESPFAELDAHEIAEIRAHLNTPGWTLHGLAAEVLLQRGDTTVARTLHHPRPPTTADATRPTGEGPFTSRIDVEQYDAYELLHPAYARQVVAAAQDIASFCGAVDARQAIDVGTGPGLPLLMLLELHPNYRFLAVEPDEAAYACLQRNVQGSAGIEPHRGGFLELALPPGQTPLITSFGASHHFNTAFMLQQAARLLQPDGVLVVADEFLPEYAGVEERNLALVRHHGAYLLASMAWVGEPPESDGGPDIDAYLDLKHSIVTATVLAAEGQSAAAENLCRTLHERLHASRLTSGPPTHDIGAFVRFYALELQAMVAGFDYEVERKTHARRFVDLAALAGLVLRRQRRVYATVGSDDWGGGTHVLTFTKPRVWGR